MAVTVTVVTGATSQQLAPIIAAVDAAAHRCVFLAGSPPLVPSVEDVLSDIFAGGTCYAAYDGATFLAWALVHHSGKTVYADALSGDPLDAGLVAIRERIIADWGSCWGMVDPANIDAVLALDPRIGRGEDTPDGTIVTWT